MGMVGGIWRWYLDLRLATKLLLFVICFIGWLVVVAALGIYGTWHAAAATRDMELSRQMIGFIAGASGIAIVLGIFFGVIISRSVLTPFHKLLEVLNELAGGNLTVHSGVKGTDEMGELAQGLARMRDEMKGIISQIAGSAGAIASASGQLSATSSQISVGAGQMALQTASVASASEEMSATSHEIAGTLGSVAANAREANDCARNGAEVIRRTMELMGKIEEMVTASASAVGDLGASSEQIGEIVGTIGDIADQTNLLALNAAIEAARAGEQGRGFAVVADEVRALAERTTAATREIGRMIQDIQAKTRDAVAAMEKGVSEVRAGADDAVQSEQAVRDILAHIDSLTGQVEQIATAVEQQSATTTAIVHNIREIRTVVEESAAGAQDTSRSAGELAQLAGGLEKLTGRFRLAG
ncbi:methyl-accepting chemotaxis protein [Geobacter hydrogenophilus]|nr:HAMP domain-containing methyl-accepting chemotaxis protein [Geobacter hydrogenophilus]